MKPWHVVGLDLGQSADYSALAVLEASVDAEPRYTVGHLHRWQLGTKYTQIVDDVRALVARRPLDRPALVVDGTGVGAAVVDLFASGGLRARLVPVVITGGVRATADDQGRLCVPKKELVSTLQVLLQGRRLELARGLPEAQALARELAAFRVKITAAANEEFGAWRERDHDDLVLSVALAAWVAEQAARITPAGETEADTVMYT